MCMRSPSGGAAARRMRRDCRQHANISHHGPICGDSGDRGGPAGLTDLSLAPRGLCRREMRGVRAQTETAFKPEEDLQLPTMQENLATPAGINHRWLAAAGSANRPGPSQWPGPSRWPGPSYEHVSDDHQKRCCAGAGRHHRHGADGMLGVDGATQHSESIRRCQAIRHCRRSRACPATADASPPGCRTGTTTTRDRAATTGL